MEIENKLKTIATDYNVPLIEVMERFSKIENTLRESEYTKYMYRLTTNAAEKTRRYYEKHE